MLYNEEFKNEYIEKVNSETTRTPLYVLHTFETAGIFEENLNKDLCTFTYQEIENMYRTINMKNNQSLQNMNSVFSVYTDFCIERNMVYDGINHYKEFTANICKELVNKFANDMRIVNDDIIHEWLDNLRYNVDKFLILAFYEGLNGVEYSDVANLRITDIDTENCIIHLRDREENNNAMVRDVPVSQELIDIAIAAYNEESYSSISGESRRNVKYMKSDLILKVASTKHERGEETSRTRSRRIYNKAFRIFRYFGCEKYMTIKAVIDSSKINWINRKTEELGIDVEDFFSVRKDLPDNVYRLKEEFENQYGDKPTNAFYVRYREYFQ